MEPCFSWSFPHPLRAATACRPFWEPPRSGPKTRRSFFSLRSRGPGRRARGVRTCPVLEPPKQPHSGDRAPDALPHESHGEAGQRDGAPSSPSAPAGRGGLGWKGNLTIQTLLPSSPARVGEGVGGESTSKPPPEPTSGQRSVLPQPAGRQFAIQLDSLSSHVIITSTSSPGLLSPDAWCSQDHPWAPTSRVVIS